MPTHHRALSALATTALLSSGLALGTAAPAQAAPVEPAPLVQVQNKDGLGDLVALITNPVLNLLGGVPGVGQAVSVTKPLVDNVLGLLNLDIVWLCDGNVIPGSEGFWTFVPTEAQAGCELAAKTIATVLGVPISGITRVIEIPLSNIPDLPGSVKAPTLTKAVAIPATAKVGTPMAATPPVWDQNATDVVTTYEWLRGGTAIAGATSATYTPTVEDLGKALSVRATGTRKDAPTPAPTSTSAAVTVAQGDAPTATVQPSIAGKPEVGGTLTVNAPTWSGTGTTNTTYQWLRDGQPVTGATAPTYVVTEADAGKALTVKVTGKRTGYADGTATSAPITVTAVDKPMTPTVTPSISGFAEVGRTLTASPGSWSAPDATFTYVWRRDGITIPGQTRPTYVVQLADIGKRLTVDVTATATGFSETVASATTAGTVNRLTSVTAAKLAKKKIRKGTKAKVVVTLRSAGVARTGQVRIYDGRRVLKTLSVKGKKTVKLPKLGVGKHRIKVTYLGSRTTAPSTSKVVVLKVVKKNKKK
ncbi:Ig-like domain repeat protein [Nocardioides deserti]|uniref:Ig-like domain repeat protein n=1 Tax=Nocardioides deserti TaxID=1588644 RepID=A0ABR6UDP7_9ACTN|nr:Ig-like domain repeat protein [Nocardioides deserti]MBC2962495.1 Ig-like domain repeat protein [Nocardioides deserti]GGO72771.1 hypothetical protein GCM10012276_16760 [Nocardioides deserti]